MDIEEHTRVVLGSAYPHSGIPGGSLQERLVTVEHDLASVAAYVKLRGRYRAWLRRYRGQVVSARRKLASVCPAAILSSMLFLMKVRHAVRRHESFERHYDPLFACAMLQLEGDLRHHGHQTWKEDLEVPLAHYKKLPIMHHLLPDAASLSERVLVQRVAALCREYVRQWDATHGLITLRARKVLLVLGTQLETNYEQGEYNVNFTSCLHIK